MKQTVHQDSRSPEEKDSFCRKLKNGQIMVLFVLMLFFVIIPFVALGVDFGLALLDKTRLSRAVDAVGVRLAANLQGSSVDQARNALEVMQANYPGFLSGLSYNAASSNWSGNGGFSSYTLGGTNFILLTNNTDELKLTINSVTNQYISVVNIHANAYKNIPSYFLRLANITNFNLGESASAQRVPNIIILVLDESRSMSGGGDASLADATTNFIQCFTNTQSQDFVGVVAFNTTARVLWPIDYLTNGAGYPTNCVPENNFVNPVIGLFKHISGSLTDANGFPTNYSANGGTCGQEGIHLGYQMAQNLLNSIGSENASLLKVNYIIFTDGAFNTVRAFFQGPGYGLNNANPTNCAPWFQQNLPVMAANMDFSPYTSVLIATNTNNITQTVSYNLATNTRFGSSGSNPRWADFTNYISATMYTASEYSSGWSFPSSSTIPLMTNTTNSKVINSSSLARSSSSWTSGSIHTICGSNPKYSWSTNKWYASSTSGAFTNWTNVFMADTTNIDTTTDPAQLWWMATVEYTKLAYDLDLLLPVSIPTTYQNPLFYRTASWPNTTNPLPYPSNTDRFYSVNTNKATLWNYPSGRQWANFYDNKVAASGTFTHTARLSDFYPYFTFGAPPTAVLTNGFTNSCTNLWNLVQYTYTNSAPRYYYSFEYGSNISVYDATTSGFSNNSPTSGVNAAGQNINTMLMNEAYFDCECQAWIARKEQNARIFFISFYHDGGTDALTAITEKRNIANDATGQNGTGISPFFSDQQTGAFYGGTNLDLTAAFQDIASKITTRLTQ